MRQYTLYKKNISRLLAVLLVMVLLIGAVPAASAAEASGTCGQNLEWTLSGDTLTITGSGAMYNYPEDEMAPWYAYRREISRVLLPEGLTNIGDLAFYGCSALEFVSMPDSVTEVGWYAFSGCTSMTMLDLSSSLKTIRDGAFKECTALPAVRLPKSLTDIGYQAFYRCESLTDITIPASVKSLGHSAFSFCYNLIRAEIQAPITSLTVGSFYGCSRLTTVILPATLKNVEEYAFYDCDGLINVVYPGSAGDREEIEEDIRRDLEAGPDNTTTPGTTDTPDNPTTPGTTDTPDDPTTPGTTDTPDDPTTPGTTDTPDDPTTPGTTDTPVDPTTPVNPVTPQPGTPNVPVTPEVPEDGGDSGTIITPDGDDGLIDETITVFETENASVSSTVTVKRSPNGDSSSSARVAVTLEFAKAWSEVNDYVVKIVDSVNETSMDIYIKDSSVLETNALKDFMGKKVIVTIRNATGSVWKIDCSRIEQSDKDISFDLSYERTDATEEQLELMGCTVGYQIKFLSDAQINAEVMIKLPLENARKNASLFQLDREGEKELLQTVVVDDAGYAHFYLASVDQKTVYLIGIDVQGVVPEEAIIPENLQQNYGVTEQLSTMEYVVTGRSSSWGMDIKQVTLILAGGMIFAAVVIGVVMFMLNKRKLKMGYIPDLDDDEDEPST